VIAREHDAEPQRGLPERLPDSERLLWQGAPDWRAVANGVFRVHLVGLYFAGLIAWRFWGAFRSGHSLSDAAISAAWLLPIALAGIGLFLCIAWLTARTTVYTITTRRIVMRVGIALPVTVNVPFGIIETAALALRGNGSGDLPVALVARERASYLNLWPHVRPWRFARPEPMLRGLTDANAVAGILADALAASAGSAVSRLPGPVDGAPVPVGDMAPAH